MTYIKLYKAGELIGAEASLIPSWVKWQQRNGLIILCEEGEADGIVSAVDNDTIYVLEGHHLNGVETDLSAVVITQAEYEEIVATLPDPEDTDPEIPDETPDLDIMTRAQLTEMVRSQAEAIQEQADTISMLQECLLEMSEAVYA